MANAFIYSLLKFHCSFSFLRVHGWPIGPTECLDLLFWEPPHVSVEMNRGPDLRCEPRKSLIKLWIRTSRLNGALWGSSCSSQKRRPNQSWGHRQQKSVISVLPWPASLVPLHQDLIIWEIPLWVARMSLLGEIIMGKTVQPGKKRPRVPDAALGFLWASSPFVPQQPEAAGALILRRGRWDSLGLNLESWQQSECWVSIP